MRRLSRATEDVLLALASDPHPVYGLELMRRTGLASGSLYPILERLEDRGLVVAEWEDDATAREQRRPRRRYYRLSPDGVELARSVRAALQARLRPAFGGSS